MGYSYEQILMGYMTHTLTLKPWLGFRWTLPAVLFGWQHGASHSDLLKAFEARGAVEAWDWLMAGVSGNPGTKAL